jgi:hypothetical protein
MLFNEPPYTERYVRWCERSVDELIIYPLLDFLKDFGVVDIFEKSDKIKLNTSLRRRPNEAHQGRKIMDIV